jgi:ubiquinone/menaquinone biosynthesis C-methylase UbiE
MSDATRAYYDEFSHWYERERGRGYHALIDDLEVAIVEPYVRHARVLEVGCGTGLILSRLASSARSAVGLDLSPGMLARARERGLNVVQGSADALPFADASFDLVCSFKVLAHVPDIERAMGEMARVTVSGGTIAAEFYNPWSLRYLAKRFGRPGAISANTTEAAVYTRYDSARDIERMRPSGTEIVAFRGVRTITPAASLFKLPLVGAALRSAEFAARESPLAYLAGFLVVVLRKL